MGAQAFQQAMSSMEAELPPIVYAYAMDATLDVPTDGCNATYQKIGFPDTVYGLLCNDSSNTFNFNDTLTTSFALVNIFLNNDTSLEKYVFNFLNVTNLTNTDLNTYFFADASPFNQYMNSTLYPAVFNHYKDSACASTNTGYTCSPRQLAYSQWASGTVLLNPLPNMPSEIGATNISYTRAFPNFTALSYTPELSFFL
jgi:hypothetical protein